MDLIWLVLGLVLAAILAIVVLVALPWYRKHGIEQARASLKEVPSVLTRIENSLEPYLSSKEYLPERVARPLRSEIQTLTELTLPILGKSVRRAHDGAMRKDFESIKIAANLLRQNLVGHNYQYVERAIAEHSKLLVDELKLDAAQREATVRDDERNLVVAAAGSGKTRTLIARIRYLLERNVSPTNILAITFTNKAAEEMEDRLTRMSVPVADQGIEGVTVSTLHALGKRVVQAATPGPSIVIWTSGPQLSEWTLPTELVMESKFGQSASESLRTFYSPTKFLTITKPRPRGPKSAQVAPPITPISHSLTPEPASNIGA